MPEEQEGARLAWMNGQEIKEQWRLTKPAIGIGRCEDNDVVLRDRCVSRHHARITCSGERYTVQDLGSRNGTQINGRRIVGPAVLGTGDEIGLAPAVQLTFIDCGPAVYTRKAASANDLEFEPESRQVRMRGSLISPPLSRAQFTLLALLAEQRGRVYSRDEIITAIWPDDEAEGISEAAVDALVRRTRLRLRELAPEQPYIVTVRGHGFKLGTNHDFKPHRT
jgi:DNA-binding winged helix-turn-helix (wHTH) protein